MFFHVTSPPLSVSHSVKPTPIRGCGHSSVSRIFEPNSLPDEATSDEVCLKAHEEEGAKYGEELAEKVWGDTVSTPSNTSKEKKHEQQIN